MVQTFRYTNKAVVMCLTYVQDVVIMMMDDPPFDLAESTTSVERLHQANVFVIGIAVVLWKPTKILEPFIKEYSSNPKVSFVRSFR